MIIILKKADFSQSNIGTLSTWRISRSLGAGATYEGVTSVDKGAAFSATVTIAEGYDIGTAGVTVTMGGTVLSGAHSISGNVITITIAEVTGNVLIKVPTINTATGEEEEPETPEVLPDTYTLNVASIPSGVDYPVTDPYKSEIFEVTTRRWLSNNATEAKGCYELNSFPFNNAEYILARIDFTKFKQAGYTSMTITLGDNASSKYAYYLSSPTYDDTWLSETARSIVGENVNTLTISLVSEALVYLGLRKISADGATVVNYFGDTFTVKFTK